MENIKGGYSKGNYKLVKHSLELLRVIFELVKDDEKYCGSVENPTVYRVKLDIKYLGNTYRFEMSEN